MSRIYVDRCTEISGFFKHRPFSGWVRSSHVGIKHYYSSYRLEVDNYDVFQVLYVRSGCLLLEQPGGSLEVLPGQTALLRIGSTYNASSPRGDTWCVYFTAMGHDRDEYRGGAAVLGEDPILRTLADIIYKHLSEARILLPDLLNSLGCALAAQAIHLGRRSHTPSQDAAIDYEARHARELIDATIRTGKGAREILRGSRYSYRQLSRRFRDAYGLSPKQYQMNVLMGEAKSALADVTIPITTIAYELGFSSSQYFAQCFKSHIGMTPTEYRKKTAGTIVRHT